MKKVPEAVKKIIESENVVKCGVNIRNDGMKLYRDFGILPRNLVELGAFAHRADKTFKNTYSRTIVSLVRMTEKYLNQTVDKPAVRTGNWEVQPLSEEQIHYAANDAYSSLMIYKKLWELATDQLPQEESTQILKHYIDLRSEHSEGKLDRATSSASTARPTTASAVIKATASSDTGVVSPTSTAVLYSGAATPQQIKAYTLWHRDGMSLDDMCVALNAEKPVLRTTAITYVVKALEADDTLPFDIENLKAFALQDGRSWIRHRAWILQQKSRVRISE
ncbi:hypothetical protein EW026_g786 [Hermanssonia centrifuga]|uniref:3'-5' exonuclease n=1 Tax=Hermanssonia centrifuga TaxID=98765 RepID=A0A4S4KU24_9APHY|nr:hypothetical protein EW026_g786 [Hermanssonia centrifuga]